MKLLDTLSENAKIIGIEYLVAGGHAVNAYTPGRQTGDVDLVITSEQADRWKEFILKLGYQIHFEHPSFLMFRPPQVGMWPIYLIIVDSTTFSRMTADASQINFGGRLSHPTVSARNLIAMKCHAAKQPDREDPLKDIRDIMQLCGHLKLDTKSEEFAIMCRKYGNETLLNKIRSLT